MKYVQSNHRGARIVSATLNALICASLLLVFINACRSTGRRGELIFTTLSMSSYTGARHRASPEQGSTFYFPILEIYDGAGDLIYHSHESFRNARILREFPESIRGLMPEEHAPHLEKLLREIPDFSSKARRIIGKEKLVILSVALQDCGACQIQEKALDDLEERLVQQQPVAILEVNVVNL